MYTQCPHCQTCFRIAEAHLQAAGGKVRCGSCQEVFDATGHLYTKLPPVDENRVPPADDVKITPADLERVEHEHIDLSATPIQGDTKIPTEQPDQSPFMESTIGVNSRYNNLDKMDAIHVPGDLEFSDSFLQFDEPSKPKQEQANSPGTINPYEDIDAKEAPVSDNEARGIFDLYSAADEMMRDGIGTDTNQQEEKSQLDRDIDELLAFADSLNKDKPVTGQDAVEPSDIEDAVDDLFATEPPTQGSTSQGQHPDDEIDETDLVIESFIGKQQTVDQQDLVIDDLSSDEPITHPSGKLYDDLLEFEKELEAGDFEDGSSFSEFNPKVVLEPDVESAPVKPTRQNRHEELPSDSVEIPLALRRSLENMEQPGRPWYLTTGLVLGILILLGGIAAQFVIFRNVELANAFPGLRPLLTKVCNSVPCRYSGRRDVSKISLTNRDVRSHPTQKNALLVSAAFVNEAEFDQPYPRLLITLSDLSGHVVARRLFTPPEYLENIYHQFLLMESGTPVHITLPVLDPGDDAINFEFTFH